MKQAKLFLLSVIVTASANAQLKSAAQLIGYGKMTFAAAEAEVTRSYWNQYETGKMNALTYVRWIPKVADTLNAGDNIMCFYEKKSAFVDYIMFQTIRKKVIDNFRKEAEKLGYKLVDKVNKPDQKTDVYSNGNINLSFVEGREHTVDPISYMIGVKVIKR